MAEGIMTTTEPSEEWKPQPEEWLVMITLVLISLMAALDATILVPLIPVRSDVIPKSLLPLTKIRRSLTISTGRLQAHFGPARLIF